MTHVDEPRVAQMVTSLARWRAIFVVLAVVVTAGMYALFERQARRLDALGAHGEPATATVTSVSRQGSSTYVAYAYEVGGRTFTWSVGERDAPYPPGESFAVLYLPEDPTLSRPGTDRSRPIAEAAANRSFSWKVAAGVFYFFAFNGVLCDVRLRRLRRTGKTEASDPQAYRTRLILTAVLLAPMLAIVFGWHATDALRRGESLWPVALGVVLGLGVLGGTGFYVLREGPARAAVRSARLLRWVVPLAVAIAALRAVAWLAGW